MKKTKQEIIADLTAFIGDNQSDEAIALIDNVSDSMSEDTEDWEQKCKDIDKAWRQKYIDRFNNKEEKDEKDENLMDETDDSDNKKLTFENLFKED